AITKRLRVSGAMKACLSTEGISAEEAVQRARDWEGLVGFDFVKEVSTREIYRYEPGDDVKPFSVEGTVLEPIAEERKRYPIVAYDMGIKQNILRKLARHGFDITVVPAYTPASKIAELDPK